MGHDRAGCPGYGKDLVREMNRVVMTARSESPAPVPLEWIDRRRLRSTLYNVADLQA